MIWTTWRQHRTTILAAVGAILALAVVALVCASIDRRDAGQQPFGYHFGCTNVRDLECLAGSGLTAITLVTTLLPVVLGVLVGVTVFSRDIERGTHVLGLTQSVGRTRWYWSRVLVVFVPVSLAMTLLGAALEWTRASRIASNYAYISRFTWSGPSRLTYPLFQSTGLVAGVYTVLGLVLGSCLALLIRHTLGAMAVTLVATTALLVGFQWVARPHYASATVEAQPNLSRGPSVPHTSDVGGGIWWLSSGFVDSEGRDVEFDYSKCGQIGGDADWGQRADETLAEYRAREDAINADMDRQYTACQRAQGVDHFEYRYHPDSLFRRFQVTEAALALALSALLLIPSLWALRRLRP
ncbi:ABC transporter permease [Prescottella agglutinans]|uniref:ABC transporter permease n=1 Tax=Prescottella agglutinans TaxID=1644129 RepID=UPI003D9602BD